VASSQRAGHRAARRRGSGARRVVIAVVLLAVVAAVVGLVREARSSGPPPTAGAAVPSSSAAAPSRAAAPATPPPPAPTPPAEPTFDRAQQSIDDPDSTWVIVDKARPLAPLDHAPADLVDIGGRQLRAEAAQAMRDMIAAAAAQGLILSVQSAYRSYDYQVDTFRNQVARFGEERAEIQVARPGYSEHQTGLAADVGGGGCDIESCFATTAEGQWVAAHGAEFGWVVRYPDGAQDVTGYKYEPWHVRYVGVALATELQRTGTRTLEEFFGLPAAPGYPG
jgi:zinc D-Ala-D-Ala carboxypeptidase